MKKHAHTSLYQGEGLNLLTDHCPVVGPKWGNIIPKDLKCVSTETVFRKRLKTHLFEKFHA